MCRTYRIASQTESTKSTKHSKESGRTQAKVTLAIGRRILWPHGVGSNDHKPEESHRHSPALRIRSSKTRENYMVHQRSPHTQSEQNEPETQMDLEPGTLEQELGTGEDAEIYQNNEGAQTGGTRSPRHGPRAGVKHKIEPAVLAFAGKTTSRAVKDPDKQGATNRSSAMENEGQEKVVRDREDAQAGLNHSGKTPA
jgi:hypothetical protein